jgi:hypothetical protein
MVEETISTESWNKSTNKMRIKSNPKPKFSSKIVTKYKT